ncbi:ubiquinone biosynthesis O-methyltransferase [Pseudohongiella nitratireducens]|jgi:2-polyprenyl-6-hydroxyphenyl methylase/3-demethylubiquinone-9 3-methyltransferase|uniref:Ubiquinone biosynthesis O-methyltransferase n=1 Tax=Pseudohongiella nitratireducens TaxID=1768907 RepID=A0A917LPT9_9GAMM|nr:bifunctional 2-polyprenyl-6-hydroxyphenol methylase/3-demethylubiquinol 3-O-methyltransferase UbiG [Pseudohongiella nitratireducens]MDF1623754.1 bifunctional 2-polyprenyl-6-hydroxyphenol methylase/3-demethylubiquinol 3-O-methyltransferase UbiG [Pseudohongiella nitratireducens]GGG48823.1 ubiquinone biosynthesis O-methyltransferase [Pseudohongiella nitratireducens]|tara:strand:+ start:8271 stop:9020 length:750 start_codon:yes stop_codon:yes gene_type:complete
MTTAQQKEQTASNQNRDDAEIRKFEALASRWWDPNSEFKPLHEINPLRMGFINRKVNPAGQRCIDIGCGGGILSEALAHQGADVTAIDLAEASLAVARLHQLESGLDIRYENIAAEAMADREAGQYDIVTCLEMLEHVPDPAAIVSACAKLVRPGGHIFLSTINRNPKAWLFAIVGAEYVLNLLPRGTHDYAHFIKPSELAFWCRQAGLQQGELTGMTYNPLTKKYRLENDVSVNYLVHYTKPDEEKAV